MHSNEKLPSEQLQETKFVHIVGILTRRNCSCAHLYCDYSNIAGNFYAQLIHDFVYLLLNVLPVDAL